MRKYNLSDRMSNDSPDIELQLLDGIEEHGSNDSGVVTLRSDGMARRILRIRKRRFLYAYGMAMIIVLLFCVILAGGLRGSRFWKQTGAHIESLDDEKLTNDLSLLQLVSTHVENFALFSQLRPQVEKTQQLARIRWHNKHHMVMTQEKMRHSFSAVHDTKQHDGNDSGDDTNDEHGCWADEQYNFNAVQNKSHRQIYCGGALMDAVQSKAVFEDSKEFVDMSLRYDPGTIIRGFDLLVSSKGGDVNKLTREELKDFVNKHFHSLQESFEFEPWHPEDWKKDPAFFSRIKDKNYRAWAADMNAIWDRLGRKIKKEVEEHPDRYSLLYVPNPVIVPGGIFREFYYWDTYWITCGVLLCEMVETAKGMIDNFIHLVKRYGFVPNGGRIYYLGRSQPPFLIPMVEAYVKHTNDVAYMEHVLPMLEKAYSFWDEERLIEVTVKDKTYRLSQYRVVKDKPRQERYKEDRKLASVFPEKERAAFYSYLASACESGWDFSSRWFAEPSNHSFTTLATWNVLPVDLNAILCMNARTMSSFFKMVGDEEKAKQYADDAERRQEALMAVFWNEEHGMWFDYDLKEKKHREAFYISSLVPLFTKCYKTNDTKANMRIEEKVLQYLETNKLLQYIGGVPTSMQQTSQQWDYPNAWPPMEHMVIEGLDQCDLPKAKKVALELAQRWVRSNYVGFKETQKMFEKYSVECTGCSGTGGEYEVQDGFGWTNGVAMMLLNKYGDQLVSDPDAERPGLLS